MQIDYALVLAAGKGTRMGRIGLELPKLLWPIFEKKLLELQILFAKHLGAKECFFNTYSQSEKIITFYNNSKMKCNYLLENDELDIGGAIHNFMEKVSDSGILLVQNGDQFIDLSLNQIQDGLKRLEHCDVVMFASVVNKSQGYNKLEIEDEVLRGIVKHEQVNSESYLTYTGMSLIKLNGIEKISGRSRFFESVANWKKYKVGILNIGNTHYWDFGTARRYYENMFKLLNTKKGIFFEFLVQNSAINTKKVKLNNYNTQSENAINLTDNPQLKIENKIILKESTIDLVPQGSGIVYGDLCEYF